MPVNYRRPKTLLTKQRIGHWEVSVEQLLRVIGCLVEYSILWGLVQ